MLVYHIYYKHNSVCVCVCVSDRQTIYHDVKTQHIMHGWFQNLSGHVTAINSNSNEEGIGLGDKK